MTKPPPKVLSGDNPIPERTPEQEKMLLKEAKEVIEKAREELPKELLEAVHPDQQEAWYVTCSIHEGEDAPQYLLETTDQGKGEFHLSMEHMSEEDREGLVEYMRGMGGTAEMDVRYLLGPLDPETSQKVLGLLAQYNKAMASQQVISGIRGERTMEEDAGDGQAGELWDGDE